MFFLKHGVDYNISVKEERRKQIRSPFVSDTRWQALLQANLRTHDLRYKMKKNIFICSQRQCNFTYIWTKSLF